jgi:hypothetical protein
MFFKPKWVKMLPDYMRPDNNKIEQLERLRTQFNIPDEMFYMSIASSQATTRKVQKYFLEEYRRQVPNASEKELWMMVLASRVDTYKNKILTDISAGNITQEEAANKFDELTAIVEKYEVIIRKIHSFGELCDYIISLDEKILGETYSSFDPFDIGNAINEILGK